ncbi:AAA family ATPase [Methylorubrum sp. POS3]|uniref:AAA family ATPase n=1 Tax=Methylorubrum sp. POS3 TaxID=2998492 RepID=UPI003727CE51
MPLAIVTIPTSTGSKEISFDAGRSYIFVGPNGAGKTRLGVYVEEILKGERSRRIAAHRSLTINDKITAINFDRAMQGLKYGREDGNELYRHMVRWSQKPAVALLDDFDFLMQALFAEQSRTAVQHLNKHRTNSAETPPETLMSKLIGIWGALLPHRHLESLELSIEVQPGKFGQFLSPAYPASEMSDGERVIFYLIGQCLLTPPNSVLIIDEPELHIHKAVISRLWDAIEAQRPDCSFLYITHDLDFVLARPAAAKFVVRAYNPPNWDIELLPENTGLPERVASELVGTRQPVLFVEGDRGSLDTTIYRHVFSDFLIEPIGSCESVIHSVASFKRNGTLHRLGSVRGCVDADARDATEIDHLRSLDVYALPLAEVESLLLLPPVFEEIAKTLEFSDADAKSRLNQLTSDVMTQALAELDMASVRFAGRRLDAELKKLAPSAQTIEDLTDRYQSAVASVNPTALAKSYKDKLSTSIEKQDLAGVLALYDNKGLLSMAARHLGMKGRKELAEYVSRLLPAARGQAMLEAIKSALPKIPL